ncbi:MAG: phage tail sheath family protein, partial [Comamonadaceae bacterium]
SALPDAAAVRSALITHAARAQSRCFAVLDSAPGQTPAEVRVLRATFDTPHAALYYPWVVTGSTADMAELAVVLPPSGFVAGIYARTDVQRGVHKAPANEVVRGALRFERNINHGELNMLNPLGVNCLRSLEGRGLRVWGARTASSDPDWKYVQQRRYMNYLEASIDHGTQWAVFEPNGERLWSKVDLGIRNFLFSEWRNGRVLGANPDEAFFVRCDRSTMTQNDLDNGRLVVMVGVAMIKPAEFAVFRLERHTADSRQQ